MKSHPTLNEAERLYKLGFSTHWLHPKSKRPIGKGWASGPRRNWHQLLATFKGSFNVGVRPGSTSKISEQKYLACIDVDIKDPKYRPLAEEALKKIIGNSRCPEVRSGSGNGSRHLYCVTTEPFPMITAEKHNGWEICVYSDGRQMVLPPSIHPSGRPYVWEVPLLKSDDLPVIKFKRPEKIQGQKIKKDLQAEVKQFDFQNVEWKSVASEKFRVLIEEGKWNGADVNKSDYLPLAATYLLENNFDVSQVVSILTDPKNELGRVAYRHVGNTDSREAAAQWLWKYTLKKAVAEYTWKKKLSRSGKNGNGPPIPSIENVVLVIQNAVAPDVFRYDLFTSQDSYGTDTPWRGKKDASITDGDVARIRLWLGRKFRFEPSREIIGDAITNIAHENAFDPITEWLDALPAWDRVQRLNGWLIANFEAKGDPSYLAQVFRKWMIGMVRRQYLPGSKFDWMPIFEGPQGIGKSSFGRLLMGEKYFLDWLPNLADKDAAQALQGILAVELGELATMRKNEMEVIKGYVTRTTDKFRPPYGKRMIESPRRCVFYGTTNREKYLRDDTGNRRFKPVLVGNLNFEALSRDREQLFAEAKYLFETFYKSNRPLELTGRAKIAEAEIQSNKVIEDESSVMHELIKGHLSNRDDFKKGCVDLKMSDLFSTMGPLGGYRPEQRNIQFAGKALTLLGFENKKINGNRIWRLR